MEELKNACENFLAHKYSIEELLNIFSWIGVPDEYISLLEETSYNLERMLFVENESNLYEKSRELITKLLQIIKEQ